jgi:hypothetical protein
MLLLGIVNSKKQLVSELNLFLIKTDPKPQRSRVDGQVQCVSGIIYQRLTNIYPKDFQLKNIFFLRLSHKEKQILSDKKKSCI